MKKFFLTVVIATVALTASINANANVTSEGEATIMEIASNLNPENAYIYTAMCQRFLNEAEQIANSEKLSDVQKQNRMSNLTSIYMDRFSQILDTWQTMTTIQELLK